MEKSATISANIRASIALKEKLVADEHIIATVNRINQVLIDCFRADGKVYLCGNGGSAADAQHLAAELSGRYYYDRPPLFCEALHVNTSYLTAVANDYGYEEIFGRLMSAMGRKGDVLIALSTSGNSPNIIRGVEQAKLQGMTTVGFTGASGGKLDGMCDHLIKIPSTDTPRIQECHMLIGHSICEVVEATLFPRP